MALSGGIRLPHSKKILRGIGGRRLLVLLAISLVIVIIAVSLLLTLGDKKNKKHANVNCPAIIVHVNGLLDKNDYKKALNELNKYESDCATSTNGWVGVVATAQLAVTNYNVGDTEKAKNYATIALGYSRELKLSEKAKIINYESMIIDLHDISKGSYDGQGGLY